jgi:hypothetical protein
MKKITLLFFLSTILLSSCWDFRNNVSPDPPLKKVWGYKPVFAVDSSILRISATGPQPVKFPAKIYVKGNLIFQNDLGSGIHVIDNTNSSAPHPIGFIKILGNSEISIKGNMLYANSFTDLVVVDVKDWQKATEVKRIKGAFRQGVEAGPSSYYSYIPLPEHGVYYECPWMAGYGVTNIQTGWVRDSVYDNNCYYP